MSPFNLQCHFCYHQSTRHVPLIAQQKKQTKTQYARFSTNSSVATNAQLGRQKKNYHTSEREGAHHKSRQTSNPPQPCPEDASSYITSSTTANRHHQVYMHTHTHTQALFAPLSVSGTRPPTAELRCRQTHPLSRSRTVLCGTTLPPREASPADDPTLSSLLLLFLLQHPGSGRGYGKGSGERSAVLNGLRCGKRAVFEAFPEGLF